MVPDRWFNGGHDFGICQTLVYAICCTVRFCKWDGDNFVFTIDDRGFVVLDLLDGLDIELIHANLSD